MEPHARRVLRWERAGSRRAAVAMPPSGLVKSDRIGSFHQSSGLTDSRAVALGSSDRRGYRSVRGRRPVSKDSRRPWISEPPTVRSEPASVRWPSPAASCVVRPGRAPEERMPRHIPDRQMDGVALPLITPFLDPGWAPGALPSGGREHRENDHRLQHPIPHQREPKELDLARTGPGEPEHPWSEGLIRQSGPGLGADLRGPRDAVGAHWEDAEVAWWIPLLFAETNPMPLKHCLWRMGLIESPECRLPLTRVTRGHAQTLDAMLQRIANLEATGRIL